jgi:hypothetical protein
MARNLGWLQRSNILEIKTDHGDGQRVREFYNIERVEPDASLFVPPANVPVRVANSIRN